MSDDKKYPPELVDLFDLIMNPTMSAGIELVKRLEPVFQDAARLKWLEAVVQQKSAVWLLPCGESLRFVQVRHPGECHNYPTCESLRSAIDAAMSQSGIGAA